MVIQVLHPVIPLLGGFRLRNNGTCNPVETKSIQTTDSAEFSNIKAEFQKASCIFVGCSEHGKKNQSITSS